MTSQFYRSGSENLLQGGMNWKSARVRVALLTDGYEIDPDKHKTMADVAPWEVGGTNYDRKPLLNRRLDGWVAKADDIVWRSLGPTWAPVGNAVLYIEGKTDRESVLIACFALDAIQPNGGDLSLKWGAAVMVFGSHLVGRSESIPREPRTAWDRLGELDL